MEIITRRHVIKGVPENFRAQYPNPNYRLFDGKVTGEVQAKLDALDLETCPPEAIDQIINPSWTALTCYECDEPREMVVHLGQGETEFMVCATCLVKALNLIGAEVIKS